MTCSVEEDVSFFWTLSWWIFWDCEGNCEFVTLQVELACLCQNEATRPTKPPIVAHFALQNFLAQGLICRLFNPCSGVACCARDIVNRWKWTSVEHILGNCTGACLYLCCIVAECFSPFAHIYFLSTLWIIWQLSLYMFRLCLLLLLFNKCRCLSPSFCRIRIVLAVRLATFLTNSFSLS